MKLRRKTLIICNWIFLENALSLEQLRATGLLTTLVTSLSPTKGIPTGVNGDLNAQDEDYMERGLIAVFNIVMHTVRSPNERLLEAEKEMIRSVIAEIENLPGGFKSTLESCCIEQSEWEELLKALR